MFFFFFLKFIKAVTDHIYLADVLKTNQTKFAVVWVKKHQKARFLSPRSSKITVTKIEGKRNKRKSEEKERRRREKKSNRCTLGFIIATLEIVFGRKKLFDAKGPFGDTIIKNPARYIWLQIVLSRSCRKFACVQTSPISFGPFSACNKGNRRRLHAGKP